MKKIFAFIIPAILVSCKSKEEKLKEQILPIVTNGIKQDSLLNKIDSIIIYKIDTLNDLLYTQRRIINKSNRYNFYIAMMKSKQTDGELDMQSAKLYSQQESLYSGILGSPTLAKIAADDFQTKIKSAKESLGKSKLYLDSAEQANTEMTELLTKIKNHKINTKNFKGYVVRFKLLGSDKKNMEVKEDSMFMYISPSFRIMPLNQF